MREPERMLFTAFLFIMFTESSRMASRIRYLLIFSFFAYTLFSVGQQPSAPTASHIDSLREAAISHANDTTKVMMLNQLSFEYNSVSPYDGIRYALQALMLAEELNYKGGMARANSSLGANYFSLADYPNAYDYWLKALAINEEVGNKNGVANHMHNIGLVFFSQKEYDKALEYFEKALAVSKEIGNKKFASNSYTAMGNVYVQKKEFSKALEYHFKALSMDEETGNKKAVSTDMINIASVYHEQGDHARAAQMIDKALPIKKEISDQMGTAKAYNLAARICLKENGEGKEKLMKAKLLLDSAVAISGQIGFLENLQNSYETLAKTEEDLGNYKEALLNYKGFYSIRDSIFSESRRNQIFNLEKKSELERQQREAEKEEEARERKRYVQIAGICLFIISMMVVVLILSKRKVRPGILNMISSLALVILFHFIQLLFHEPIVEWTHHDLLLTFIMSLGIGAVVIPAHHKVEHWIKQKLSSGHAPVVAEGEK